MLLPFLMLSLSKHIIHRTTQNVFVAKENKKNYSKTMRLKFKLIEKGIKEMKGCCRLLMLLNLIT